MDGMEIFMAIIEKGGYGSIKDSGGRASGNWKGMSGIKGSGGMKGMEENRKPHRHIRSFQVIILGFALLILAGSLLMLFPGQPGTEGERALRMHFLRQLQQPA